MVQDYYGRLELMGDELNNPFTPEGAANVWEYWGNRPKNGWHPKGRLPTPEEIEGFGSPGPVDIPPLSIMPQEDFNGHGGAVMGQFLDVGRGDIGTSPIIPDEVGPNGRYRIFIPPGRDLPQPTPGPGLGTGGAAAGMSILFPFAVAIILSKLKSK